MAEVLMDLVIADLGKNEGRDMVLLRRKTVLIQNGKQVMR